MKLTSAVAVHDILRLLPLALVLYLISQVGFDALAGRDPFWMSKEQVVSMLWTGCFIVPFMLFGLAVATQRQKSGN